KTAVWYIDKTLSLKVMDEAKKGLSLVNAINYCKSRRGDDVSMFRQRLPASESLPYFLQEKPTSYFAPACAYMNPSDNARRNVPPPLRRNESPPGPSAINPNESPPDPRPIKPIETRIGTSLHIRPNEILSCPPSTQPHEIPFARPPAQISQPDPRIIDLNSQLSRQRAGKVIHREPDKNMKMHNDHDYAAYTQFKRKPNPIPKNTQPVRSNITLNKEEKQKRDIYSLKSDEQRRVSIQTIAKKAMSHHPVQSSQLVLPSISSQPLQPSESARLSATISSKLEEPSVPLINSRNSQLPVPLGPTTTISSQHLQLHMPVFSSQLSQHPQLLRPTPTMSTQSFQSSASPISSDMSQPAQPPMASLLPQSLPSLYPPQLHHNTIAPLAALQSLNNSLLGLPSGLPATTAFQPVFPTESITRVSLDTSMPIDFLDDAGPLMPELSLEEEREEEYRSSIIVDPLSNPPFESVLDEHIGHSTQSQASPTAPIPDPPPPSLPHDTPLIPSPSVTQREPFQPAIAAAIQMQSSSGADIDKKLVIGGINFLKAPPVKKSRLSNCTVHLPLSAPPPSSLVVSSATALPHLPTSTYSINAPPIPIRNCYTKAAHTSLPIPRAIKRKDPVETLNIPQANKNALIFPKAHPPLKITSRVLPIAIPPERRRELLTSTQAPKSAVAHKVIADQMKEIQMREELKARKAASEESKTQVKDFGEMMDNSDTNDDDDDYADEAMERMDDDTGMKDELEIRGEEVQNKRTNDEIIWADDEQVPSIYSNRFTHHEDNDVIYDGQRESEKIDYECDSLVFGHAEGFNYEIFDVSPEKDRQRVEDTRMNEVKESEGRDDKTRTSPESEDDEIDKTMMKAKTNQDWLSKLEMMRKELDAKAKKKRRRLVRPKNAPKAQPGIRVTKCRMNFDPSFVRQVDTPMQGKLRRGREDWKSYFKTHETNSFDKLDRFRLHSRVTGFLNDSVYPRENQRLIFARFNPNPEIPLILTGGINRCMYTHNYQTGDMYSLHRPHATYATAGAWSECGQYLIAAGTDQQVVVVAPDTVPTIRRRMHSTAPVVGVGFIQNGPQIAVFATKDGKISVYDTRLNKIISVKSGLPEITCMDVNPQEQATVAVGCKNGRVFKMDIYEDHRYRPLVHSFEKFDIPGSSPAFMQIPYQDTEKYVDLTPVKNIRFSSVNELAEFKYDILVTKGDRRGDRGDSVYRLHWMEDDETSKCLPSKDPFKFSEHSALPISTASVPIVTEYIPPPGQNISSASFAFCAGTIPGREKRAFQNEYVVATTDEGFVFLFDGKTGDLVDGYAVPNNHHPSNDFSRILPEFKPRDKFVAIKSIRDSKPAFDFKLPTQITAIDCCPDPTLGMFTVGGWGHNPSLFYFQINSPYENCAEFDEIEDLKRIFEFENLEVSEDESDDSDDDEST
ncbi:hypothetical protein PFISCL1PPCAC_15030, partial [Pristionchus fissidentatus]